MAVTKQIDVIVSAEDQYSGPLGGLIEGITGIGIAAVAAEAAIGVMGAAVSIIPIQIGREFFETAVDYHDAMLDVHAVAQSVGTSQREIEDIIDRLVLKWPLTGQTAGEALELIAQRGWGTAEAMEVVTDATVELSIATSTDLQTAVQAVLTIMNQYGFELDEIKEVTNILAAAQFNSSAAVRDFAEAMKYAGPIAVQAGISFNELAGFLAILRDMGLEASQTGTVLRMAIIQLMKETEAHTAVLEKYGLTYDDVNPSVVGLTGVIEAFEGKTITAKDAVDLFGARAAIFGSVINMGAESVREMTATVTDTTAAADGAQSKMSQWSVVLDMVTGDIDKLKESFGEDLVDAIIAAVGTDSNSGIRGFIAEIIRLEDEFGGVSQLLLDTFEFLENLGRDMFKEIFGDTQTVYDDFYNIMSLLTTTLKAMASWGVEFLDVFHDIVQDGMNLEIILDAANKILVAMLIPIALIHDQWTLWWSLVGHIVDRFEYLAAVVFQTMAENLIAPLRFLNDIVDLGLDDVIDEWEASAKKWGETAENAFDTEAPSLWTDNVVRGYLSADEAIDQLWTTHGNYNETLRISTIEAQRFGLEGSEAANKIKEGLEDAKTAVEGLITSANGTKEAFESGTIVIGQMEEGFIEVQEAIDFMNLKGDETDETMKAIVEDVDAFSRGMIEANKEAAQFTYETNEAGTMIIGWKGNTEDAKDAMAETADEAGKLKDELSEIEKFELEMELEEFRQQAETARTIIETNAEIIRTQIEWEAKLDIAEVEAGAEVLISAFESVSASIVAVSDAVGSMFAAMASSNVSPGRWLDLKRLLEREMDIQEKLVDSQVEMNDAQIALMEEKLRQMRDQGGITYNIAVAVEGDVDGWLTGLISSLMQEVMIKATAEDFHCMCEV